MESLTPQVMHKLVFTILVHGLPDAQTGVAHDILLDAQSNPNPQVRELAVVALSELPIPAAKRVAALTRALRDSHARVRRRAARALGDFGVHAIPAVAALAAGLKDADISVRRDCAGTLGRLGPAATPAARVLVSLLNEPETRSRVVTATAIKRIGKGAVPALLEGLNHPDAELRARSVTLLAILAPDDEIVLEALRAATVDLDAEVRRRAAEATDPAIPFALVIA